MQMLQGNSLPVKVNLFLIVNPPSWFNTIWNIMKTMLSRPFQRRVRMIHESELGEYLCDNYRDFLPEELGGGTVPTDDLVADFVAYRLCYENPHVVVSNNGGNTCEEIRAWVREEMERRNNQPPRVRRAVSRTTTSLASPGARGPSSANAVPPRRHQSYPPSPLSSEGAGSFMTAATSEDSTGEGEGEGEQRRLQRHRSGKENDKPAATTMKAEKKTKKKKTATKGEKRRRPRRSSPHSVVDV